MRSTSTDSSHVSIVVLGRKSVLFSARVPTPSTGPAYVDTGIIQGGAKNRFTVVYIENNIIINK